jgi:pyruvate/oxaloacetate carboxyltransferase
MYSPDLFPNNPRVRIVSSFEELVDTRFRDGVNALCWPRVLEGDFAEIVAHLDMPPGITHLTAE